MSQLRPLYPSVSLPPVDTGLGYNSMPVENPTDKEPPRRPDWLIVLIIGLLLLSLLIAWLTDLPNRFVSQTIQEVNVNQLDGFRNTHG
ncbi:hypothetical protein ACFSUS_26115 [Spirosoma soli]|uniref:Uncharacterized protein n=1 Tax=Spirosoma soli TaxID=1770529 RepID=A0ABW5MCZ5_9BACT